MMMTAKHSEIPPGGLPPAYTARELADMAARAKRQEVKANRARVNRERWQLLNRFIDDGMAGLELSDAAVWFALFRFAKHDGIATVPRAHLEARTGCARSTVALSLRRLVSAGWLDRLRRGGPSGGVAVYRVRHPEKVGR